MQTDNFTTVIFSTDNFTKRQFLNTTIYQNDNLSTDNFTKRQFLNTTIYQNDNLPIDNLSTRQIFNFQQYQFINNFKKDDLSTRQFFNFQRYQFIDNFKKTKIYQHDNFSTCNSIANFQKRQFSYLSYVLVLQDLSVPLFRLKCCLGAGQNLLGSRPGPCFSLPRNGSIFEDMGGTSLSFGRPSTHPPPRIFL